MKRRTSRSRVTARLTLSRTWPRTLQQRFSAADEITGLRGKCAKPTVDWCSPSVSPLSNCFNLTAEYMSNGTERMNDMVSLWLFAGKSVVKALEQSRMSTLFSTPVAYGDPRNSPRPTLRKRYGVVCLKYNIGDQRYSTTLAEAWPSMIL